MWRVSPHRGSPQAGGELNLRVTGSLSSSMQWGRSLACQACHSDHNLPRKSIAGCLLPALRSRHTTLTAPQTLQGEATPATAKPIISSALPIALQGLFSFR